MVSHSDLAHYYKNNFSLMQYHKYSLNDIDNMIPYERDLYITMLIESLERDKVNG
jgi:hypothetical protein